MAKTINQFQRESRMDCYAENAQLRAENAALAAALAAKDAALERCTKFTQEDYDALDLKPHAALVAKIKADAVRDAAAINNRNGMMDFLTIADLIERGEVE